MHRSKLISSLQAIPAAKFKDFEDFVLSPFFNKQEELSRLVKILKKYHPEFPEQQIRKQIIFSQLFPEQAYDDKKMRYTMSSLNKLAEKFFQQMALLSEELHLQYLFLEKMVDHNLEKQYTQTKNQLEKKLQKQSSKGADYFFHMHKLASLADRHFLLKQERSLDINVERAAEYLDWFYLAKKLELSCSMIDRQAILTADYKIHHLDFLETIGEQYDFSEQPVILLYSQLLELIRSEPSKNKMDHLMGLADQYSERVPRKNLEEIYAYLINFCARAIRAGKEEFVERALNIYLEGIQKKFFFDKGFLSPWTFKNVVSLGLRLKKYELADQFITENSSFIHPHFREDALHFNLADLYFHKKDYEQVLFHVHQLKYTDIFYNLNGRVLLLKTYFHMDETSALLSLIASFTIYLKRDKTIGNNTKKSYLNFCDCLFRIIRAGSKDEKYVNQKIEEAKFLIDRKWLKAISSLVSK